MLRVDLWTWICARCGWKADSQRTVNHQQAVADALIRCHIQQHEKLPGDPEGVRPAHRSAKEKDDVSRVDGQ